jgi:WD40 repeat protein
LITNQHIRYFPENKPITQINSKNNSFIVAVGYNQGTIVILDVENQHMKILFKLKNHEDCINCLFWFPDNENEIVQEEKNNLATIFNIENLSFILCSSAEDKTIRFWCVSSGNQLRCLKAPGLSSTIKSNTKQNNARINYTPICWPNYRYIIAGSYKYISICVYFIDFAYILKIIQEEIFMPLIY